MKMIFKKALIVLITISIMLILGGCKIYKEELIIYDCGSGFYFNRNHKYDYYIKELDIKSDGNQFLCEDYFYSEEYGKEYTISDGFFDIGTVKLAKKSDYYNETEYRINVDSFTEERIKITADMDYVYIYSETGYKKELFIYVEPRDLPLDITLDNVNIYTSSSIPVFLSGTTQAININLVGANLFRAGDFGQRSSSQSSLLNNGLTMIEHLFNLSYDAVYGYIENHPDYISNNSVNDITYDTIGQICDTSAELMEQFVNDAFGFLGGENGIDGFTGVACFMHLGGVSFYGDGTIYIKGGKGGDGMDASDSVIGLADGGNGGEGGIGLVCSYLIDYEENATIDGGDGGIGGAPSDGMFGYAGSSGNYGKNGSTGMATKVAKPRDTTNETWYN